MHACMYVCVCTVSMFVCLPASLEISSTGPEAGWPEDCACYTANRLGQVKHFQISDARRHARARPHLGRGRASGDTGRAEPRLHLLLVCRVCRARVGFSSSLARSFVRFLGDAGRERARRFFAYLPDDNSADGPETSVDCVHYALFVDLSRRRR